MVVAKEGLRGYEVVWCSDKEVPKIVELKDRKTAVVVDIKEEGEEKLTVVTSTIGDGAKETEFTFNAKDALWNEATKAAIGDYLELAVMYNRDSDKVVQVEPRKINK